MPHYDLSAYLSDDALTLEGIPSTAHPDGKAYTIASPSAKFGLQLRRAMVIWASRDAANPPTAEELADIVALVTDDDGNTVDLHTRLMGPAYQQMVDDGVSDDRLQMVWDVVVAHYGSGAEVARMIVEQTAGEAQARGNRATRRAAKRTAGKTSATGSTGAGKRTRPPASPASSTTPPTGSEAQAG